MKKRFILILIVFSFLAFVSLFINRTYARYKGSAESAIPIGVSLPIYRDTITSLSIPLNEMKPGSEYIYNFYVTNALDASSISFVSLDYFLTVERSTNLPVDITLLKDIDPNNILLLGTSPTYTMDYSVETIHNYTLKLTWNSSYSDYNYSNLVEYVNVIAHAEQKVS